MRKSILLKTSAFAVLMLYAFMSKATIWRVNNNPNYTQGCNHCFSSLQTAIDDSTVMAGDTIHLEASPILYLGPGNYNGVNLNKRLVILGPGYFLNENSGLQNNTTSATLAKLYFLSGSDYSVVNGISIAHGAGSIDRAIEINNSSHISIEGCYLTRIYFNNNSPISDIVIKKSFITDEIDDQFGADLSNLYISNSCILGNLHLRRASYARSGEIIHCVLGKNSSTIDVTSAINMYNNIIYFGSFIQWNNGTNIHDNIFIQNLPSWLTGGNNTPLPDSTVFANTGSQDSSYNVKPTCSVCYTGFPTGTETIGIYGGADPYRLSGIPNIPTIYQLQSPLNIQQGGTINVDISTRSND